MLVERNADTCNIIYKIRLDAENPMNMTIPFTKLTDQHYNVYIISDDFLQKESNLNSTQFQMEYLPYENKQSQYTCICFSSFCGNEITIIISNSRLYISCTILNTHYNNA